jgi:hypothetical protein
LPTLEVLGFVSCASGLWVLAFLSVKITATTQFDKTDFRNAIPRFTPEARKENLALVGLLRNVAERKHATPGQCLLAWLLAQKPRIVPPSATPPKRFKSREIDSPQVPWSEYWKPVARRCAISTKPSLPSLSRSPTRDIIGFWNILARGYAELDHDKFYRIAIANAPELVVAAQDSLKNFPAPTDHLELVAGGRFDTCLLKIPDPRSL